VKIFFPEYRSAVFPNRKQGVPGIILFMVIGFFVGVCGSYLSRHVFVFLTIIALGIAGALVGRVVRALHKSNKRNRALSTRINKNVPEILSGWNYRPRQIVRRFGAVGSAGAETIDVPSPNPLAMNGNNDAWFNGDALERGSRIFVHLDPTVEDATAEASCRVMPARFRCTTKVP
jgi:uncharacterized membrane protein YeaQ/YmgE (transglycosylase-associated protein family)